MKITARLRIVALVALPAGAALGCRGGSTAPSAAAVEAGTYALATIDGAALPLTTVPPGLNANCTGITDSGTLVLSAGPTQGYDLKLNAHFVCAQPPINNVTGGEVGTWSATGGQVTFTAQRNVLNLSSGTLNGSTLTLTLDLPSYAPSGVSAGRVSTEWRKQ